MILTVFWLMWTPVLGTTDPDDIFTSTMPPPPSSDGSACTELKDPAMTQETVAKLSAEYFNACLATLGKDPLSTKEAGAVWSRILEINGGSPEYVPDHQIRRLGWITTGIPPSHLLNLTLTDVDTITALGTFRNLSDAQLNALAQAFTEQWSAKEPEDWTDIDLAMLGQILCGFNATDLLRVHPDAYKIAALDGKLANLRGCNNETTESLAKLAVHPDAFGETNTWEHPQVRAVGCTLSGLPLESLMRIVGSAMVGLTVESVRCLPPKVVAAFTPDQLAGLSPAAAAAVANPQRELLDSSQVLALSALVEEHVAKNDSAYYPSMFNVVFGLVIIFVCACASVAVENEPYRNVGKY